MPIKVACQCGQSFAAKDEMAGKTVKCPKCGRPLKIGMSRPAPAPAAAGSDLGDLFDEIGLAPEAPTAGPPCPSCGKGMVPNAVLCTSCGFNLQTGQRMASAASDSGLPSGASEAEKMVAKAAAEIAKQPIGADSQDFGDGTSPWAYVMVLFMPIIFLVALFAIMQWARILAPTVESLWTGITGGNSFAMVIGAFLLLSSGPFVFSWIRITWTALDDNVFFGMLCILVMFVFVPVYGFIRGKDLFVWAIVYVVSGVFWFASIVGLVILLLLSGGSLAR